MRRAILLLVACVLPIGCSQNPYLDANIELMNAERRGLEDRLYELEYEYETSVEELERLRRENLELRSRSGLSGESPATNGRPRIERSPRNGDEDLTVPQIELPPQTDEAARRPAPLPVAPVPIAQLNGPDQSTPDQSEMEESSSDKPAVDQRVTHVKLQRRSLRGVDFDEQPGDDGLALVVEPRNTADEIVSVAGPITVVVLDYAYRGSPDARVAHWELTVDDIRRFLRTSPANEGIQLDLLWPERPPDHERLLVHIRYYAADGRKLETKGDVYVNLATKLSQRWTPRVQRSADLAPTELEQNREPIAMPEWKPNRF